MFSRTARSTLLLALAASATPALAQKCDFDNDGYADFIVGSPSSSYDTGFVGHPDIRFTSGEISIMYGGHFGPDMRKSLTAGLFDLGLGGGSFGTAIAVGDFNGDGYTDAAVSNPGAGGTQASGAVVVMFGSSIGLKLFDLTVLTPPDFSGSTGFGQALAAGDFNADGIPDLAVGAPSGSGRVYEFLSSGGVAFATRREWSQSTPGVPLDPVGGGHFGQSLATGDFNGDGKFDLAIGAPDHTYQAVSSCGVVYVLPGSSGGLTASGSQYYVQGEQLAGSRQRSDQLGFALAAGKFNSDSFWDLAIGVPGEDVSGQNDAGQIHVVHGSAAGLKTDRTEQVWSQASAGIPGGPEAGDKFGTALAVGGFNGDGFDDLAVSVPGEDIKRLSDGINIPDSGAVNVLYAQVTVVSGVKKSSGLGSASAQCLTLDSPGFVNEPVFNGKFGLCILGTRTSIDEGSRGELVIGCPAYGMYWAPGGTATLATPYAAPFTSDMIGFGEFGKMYSGFGQTLGGR